MHNVSLVVIPEGDLRLSLLLPFLPAVLRKENLLFARAA